MAHKTTVIAFDLYGTLLSTESIAAELAGLFGDEAAKSVAALWRRYQLEYTWRINSMGIYRSFSEITRGALQHAVAETGLTLSANDVDRLMKAYDALHTFPEVPSALKTIECSRSVKAYVFSNGTRDMVSESVGTSPSLSPYASVFQGLVSVEGVQVFKPDKRAYDHLLKEVGKDGTPGDVWLVSANPFDALGAASAGLRSAWVDRAGKGWVDRLGDIVGSVKPTLVACDVDKAVQEIIRSAR
ncbi:Haloacetate dehalogenase H-2 [Madurella fahalii]|uniref:Haloacetate dehalogenase H-2 n=1 Tax=Madurella fahalii TaxID=1157608 RepID=A0ABQ0GIK9_9PEZI